MIFDIFKKKKVVSKHKFLVVDDEEDILEIYEEEFSTRYGVEVKSCTGVEAAVKYLMTSPFLPDLIICDINIPNGKSGLQMSRELKKRNIDIPIIYVSGMAGGEVHDDKYTILNKPINMTELDKLVKQYIG